MSAVYEHYNTPQYLNAKDTEHGPLYSDDMSIIPTAEMAYRGICSDHIESGNDFIKNGIKQIMTKTFVIERTMVNERDKTDEDKNIDTIHFTAIIKSVNMKNPITTATVKPSRVLPEILYGLYLSSVFCNSA